MGGWGRGELRWWAFALAQNTLACWCVRLGWSAFTSDAHRGSRADARRLFFPSKETAAPPFGSKDAAAPPLSSEDAAAPPFSSKAARHNWQPSLLISGNGSAKATERTDSTCGVGGGGVGWGGSRGVFWVGLWGLVRGGGGSYSTAKTDSTWSSMGWGRGGGGRGVLRGWGL